MSARKESNRLQISHERNGAIIVMAISRRVRENGKGPGVVSRNGTFPMTHVGKCVYFNRGRINDIEEHDKSRCLQLKV